MKKEDYKTITDMVLSEVERAKTLFPEDFVNQHEGYAVLLEEIDELWQEVKKNQRNYDLLGGRYYDYPVKGKGLICGQIGTKAFPIGELIFKTK